MWSLFLFLRLLSSSPVVLVLSWRSKYFKQSPIVVTYMSREDIPLENWKNYENWAEGDCWEEGGEKKPFTRVYLWEDNTRWIQNGNWKKYGLLDKLNACKNIIEFNIDGGPFNELRIQQEQILMQNYANELVGELKWATKTQVTITWYDNSVYGMDWSFGPYHGMLKFTWKKEMGKKLVDTQEEVKQLTYLEFWNRLISETCKEIGECFGILVAYANSKLISCHKLIVNDKPVPETECYQAYLTYESKLDDGIGIEPLVKYLENLKKDRKDNKGEL